jgi:hypothetical protein
MLCKLTTACLFLAASTHLQAQSLDGTVVRDPAADTVTYDFHLDGPPLGHALIWTGPWMLSDPYLSPFGPLWIDPFALYRASPFLPLDPLGPRSLQGIIPSWETAGLPLLFQSLFVDSSNQLRFSANAMLLLQNCHIPCNVDYGLNYDTQSADIRATGNGSPGATVVVQVVNAGGPRYSATALVLQDGTFALQGTVPGGIQSDDKLQILCNGTLLEEIDPTR